MENLIEGFRRFRKEAFPVYEDLFRTRAHAQSPQTLFIGCSDSRVIPELLTQRQPRAGAGSDGMSSTAAIRHALRALASEMGLRPGLRNVKLLRPLVAQAHEVLRERLEAGGSVEAYLRGRARLADSAVIGLLHFASVSSGIRGNSMVAPLAAVAIGGYGRRELAPGSDLDLLFLLPESIKPKAADAMAACVNAVVCGLWDLGRSEERRVGKEC